MSDHETTTTRGRAPGSLRELDEAECWQRLADGSVGLLAYVDGDGPVILPLNYVVHEGTVLVRTASYNHLAIHLPGQRVALEVGRHDDHDHSGWSVLVRGRAEHVLAGDLVPPPDWADAEPWADGIRTMVFRVTPTAVTGRVLAARDVTPQAGHRPGAVQRHPATR